MCEGVTVSEGGIRGVQGIVYGMKGSDCGGGGGGGELFTTDLVSESVSVAILLFCHMIVLVYYINH